MQKCISVFNQHILKIKKQMVRVKGLEPPRLAAPEPKSGASTNSATPAHFNISTSHTVEIMGLVTYHFPLDQRKFAQKQNHFKIVKTLGIYSNIMYTNINIT